MALSASSLRQNAPPILAGTLATVGLTTGLYSFYNPPTFAQNIGIPNIPTSAIPFALFAGARNISVGISVLALLYDGQKRAVGFTMLAGVATSL